MSYVQILRDTLANMEIKRYSRQCSPTECWIYEDTVKPIFWESPWNQWCIKFWEDKNNDLEGKSLTWEGENHVAHGDYLIANCFVGVGWLNNYIDAIIHAQFIRNNNDFSKELIRLKLVACCGEWRKKVYYGDALILDYPFPPCPVSRKFYTIRNTLYQKDPDPEYWDWVDPECH